MLHKVQKGDNYGFRSRITPADVPKEALPLVVGLHEDKLKVRVEAIGELYEVDTTEMNALELACVFGHSKLATLIIEDFNMRAPRDFQIKGGGDIID